MQIGAIFQGVLPCWPFGVRPSGKTRGVIVDNVDADRDSAHQRWRRVASTGCAVRARGGRPELKAAASGAARRHRRRSG